MLASVTVLTDAQTTALEQKDYEAPSNQQECVTTKEKRNGSKDDQQP